MNEDAEKEEKKSVSFSFSARRPRNRKRGRKTPQSGRSRKQTGTSFRATKPGNNSVKPPNPPPPIRLPFGCVREETTRSTSPNGGLFKLAECPRKRTQWALKFP